MTKVKVSAISCGALLLGAGLLSAPGGSIPATESKEEIYIIRSVRTSRLAPGEFCAQFGTGSAQILFEDQYIFRAVSTRTDDGAVFNALGNKIASAHTCLGKTGDPNIRDFYAEGEIAGMSFRGRGKCTLLKMDFPELGLSIATCFLHLSGLKVPYTGGLLTSNTLVARNTTGEQSDPPRYVQPSIATVRLWKGGGGR